MNTHLDHLYYINLDKRVDRDKLFVSEVLPFFDAFEKDFTRVSAVDTTAHSTPDKRAAGCTLSHLEVAKLARKAGHKKILVLEDDFEPSVSPSELNERIDHLFTHFPDFNMCQIAYNARTHKGGIIEPIDKYVLYCCGSQTSSGYLIDTSFYDVLVPAWEDSAQALLSGALAKEKALDVVWAQFQTKENKWYLLEPCGYQRLSDHSDIQGTTIKYKEPSGYNFLRKGERG